MTRIHETAVVSPRAEVGDDVEIGPCCVVGPNVKIGAKTRLQAHVVLDGHTTLGEECALFPFACIGTQTQDLKYRGATTFVEIGDRTTLREYVTVNSGTEENEVTRVGSECHIMAYVHIAHGCRVGNGVIMSNATNLAGHIVVEDHVVFGGVTGVHQFVHVGTLCMIGGMSRITQDCPPYMLVVGNPAEVKGLNNVALRRAGVPAATRSALKQAYQILFRQGLSTSEAVSRVETAVTMTPEVEHLLNFIKQSERGTCR